jgi:hypothetical protein
MAQFDKITGAACWASYLINGDASGLTDREVTLANHWLATNEVLDVVDCDAEPHFTWNYDLHTGDVMARGGNVLEYTVRIE